MNVWMKWSLVMYGATRRYNVRPDAERNPAPAGEGFTPGDYWLACYERATDPEQRAEIEREAEQAWEAWVRRPEPPPEGETLDELIDRVVQIGEGWDCQAVALALRCTPTFVRRARIARERSPETGRLEGSFEHARELLDQGMTLRQVAMLTGIPKSTLHEALERAA